MFVVVVVVFHPAGLFFQHFPRNILSSLFRLKMHSKVNRMLISQTSVSLFCVLSPVLPFVCDFIFCKFNFSMLYCFPQSLELKDVPSVSEQSLQSQDNSLIALAANHITTSLSKLNEVTTKNVFVTLWTLSFSSIRFHVLQSFLFFLFAQCFARVQDPPFCSVSFVLVFVSLRFPSLSADLILWLFKVY